MKKRQVPTLILSKEPKGSTSPKITPARRSFDAQLEFFDFRNEFRAQKLFKSDFNVAYESPLITMDSKSRTMTIQVTRYRDQSISKQIQRIFRDETPREEFIRDVQDKIVIHWDAISGIEFQYSPCDDTYVAIELYSWISHPNEHLSSNFYFIQVTKADCATYFDQIMLKEERLRKLAIVGFPTWATFVNRYKIPIYYSYRVRSIITLCVNIYIIISLIWGFYDIYKHLPFVGDRIKRFIGPIIEPLLQNRVMLLIPLLLNRLGMIVSGLMSYHVEWLSGLWGILRSVLDQILQNTGPLRFVWTFYDWIKNLSLSTFTSIWTMIYNVLYPIYTISSVVVAPLVVLVKSLVNLFQIMLMPFISIAKSLFALGAVIISPLVWIFYTIISPCWKLKETIPIQPTTIPTSNLKSVWMDFQVAISPFQALWTGIRRISDSIHHFYLVRIKYLPVWKKTLYVCIIAFCLLVGLFFIIFILF